MKTEKRKGLIALLLFWIVFILIYTYRFVKFPIFEDEAINLLMAERLFVSPAANFFIYLKHGFLPTLGWLISLLMIFFRDSLLTGRLLSVLLASSLLYWFFLVGKEYKLPLRFFVLSACLLLFSPILFLNSRIALFDTAVMVFSVWSLFFLMLSFKKSKPFYLCVFFLVFLACLLIKFTSLFILPSLIYLFWVKFREIKGLIKYKHSLISVLSALTTFLLIISPFFFWVSGDLEMGLVFNLKTGEIINRVRQNFWLFINWSKVYYPFLPLSLLSFVVLVFDKRKTLGKELMTALLIWFTASLAIMVCFNRFYYPRHILMLLVPLQAIPVFVLLRYSVKTSILFVALVILMRIALFKDLVFDSTFTKAKMAKEDRFQYFEDYTSGINISSIASFITSKALKNSDEKITVWLDGSWVMEYGIRRALRQIPNLEIKSFVDFESHRYPIAGKVIKDPGRLNYVVVNKNRPLNLTDLVLEEDFDWGGYHPEYIYVFK